MATKKLAEKRLAVDVAREVIDSLPPDATLAEIEREIFVARTIAQGLNDVADGRVLSNDEMKKRIQSWQF